MRKHKSGRVHQAGGHSRYLAGEKPADDEKPTPKTNRAIISIGSNIDADNNITSMFEILDKKVKILHVSSFKKTRPIGIPDQPDFTNGVAEIETRMSGEELNRLLKSIEDHLGRDRSAPKYGPRTMDLDIVMWNQKIVDEDYYNRDFLQECIQEIISPDDVP